MNQTNRIYGAVNMRVLLSSLLLVAAFGLSGKAYAQEREDVSLELQARRLIEEGTPQEAISLLRGNSDSLERAFLLARAYLDAGNDFWAMRVLHESMHLAEDCALNLWLAFVHIRQGGMDEASDVLGLADCPEGSPLEFRQALLEVLIASNSGERDVASERLREAAKKERAFPEDAVAFRALRASVEKGYIPPISGRLQLHSGWTSNSLAGSPVDPALVDGTLSSLLGNLAANSRFLLPTGTVIRPALDTELRTFGVAKDPGRDLSYLMLSLRPGLLLGARGDAFVGYRLESLGLLGGDQFDDGPLWFYHAHRVEADVDLLPWLTAFGGAGYRGFREMRRSRIEIDGGLGAAWRPVANLSLLGALMGRYHSTSRGLYDLVGAMSVVQIDLGLPRNASARFGFVASFEDYPESEGFFLDGSARRDFLAKANVGLWKNQAKAGVRAGVTYEFSNRFSSALEYEYLDHRVLARVQWSFSFDPRGPSTTRHSGHVSFDWGLEGDEGSLEDTIQDLLRQDESVRASSSCVD